MDIYFRQTTLFNTLVMLVLLFGGLGLIARSLRSVRLRTTATRRSSGETPITK